MSDFRFRSREWFRGALHRAAVAKETADAVRAFDTAAKKVQKMLSDIAGGNSGAEKKILRVVSSLEERLSKPEIRGNRDAYTKCEKVASTLRKSISPAIESGQLARAAERDRLRLASVSAEQETRRSGRSHGDVAFRQYQDELAISRGRR